VSQNGSRYTLARNIINCWPISNFLHWQTQQ